MIQGTIYDNINSPHRKWSSRQLIQRHAYIYSLQLSNFCAMVVKPDELGSLLYDHMMLTDSKVSGCTTFGILEHHG